MKWIGKLLMLLWLLVVGAYFIVAQIDKNRLASDTAHYKQLADSGDADAQYEYGRRLFYGWGVEPDPAAAVKWYQKSAEQGDPNGEFCFGQSQPPAQRIPWLLKSAAQDNEYAQMHLGMLYETQNAPFHDDSAAYVWFRLAERHPYFAKPIDNRSDAVAKKMTRPQIEAADKKLEGWKPERAVPDKPGVC